MFSLLFGMGFVLFLDRAMQTSSKPRLLFLRRILVLGIFGVLHIVYVWSGDILLNYAIVALFLLLFVNTPAKRLWKWGAAFARAGIFTHANEHRKALRNMLLFGLLIGLPSALYIGLWGLSFDMMLPDYRGALIFGVQTMANVALCFAYMAAIALAYLSGKRWLQYLAPAGRMALTNYLTHSIVFTTLFYGYGFGLYGEFGRFATTLMALALYGGQLWFSTWWLQRYQYGPMEWLWRSATYLKLQPMRKLNGH